MATLISIILPVYNGDQYLQEAIESVLQQSYQNWELLIIDDHSTDRTPEIANGYCETDTRIHYYYNKENIKLPATLNRGFKLAAGDYFTWISDDNRLTPNFLESFLNAFNKNPGIEFIYSDYQTFDQEGETHSIIGAEPDKILNFNIVGVSFMFTRKIYSTVGDFNEQLFLIEDYEYWIRAYASFQFFHLNESLYQYRLHEKSLTNTRKKEISKIHVNYLHKIIGQYLNDKTINETQATNAYLCQLTRSFKQGQWAMIFKTIIQLRNVRWPTLLEGVKLALAGKL